MRTSQRQAPRPAAKRMLWLMGMCVVLAGCGLSDPGGNETECSNAVSGQWTYLGIPAERIQTIAINPRNPSHILVGTGSDFSYGTQGKIFRSTNCGTTWKQVWEGGDILKIRFNPRAPHIVYANPFGMIRSMDGGGTWSHISNGLTDYLSFTSRIHTFAIDPERPQRLYAGTEDLGGGRLFYTDNSGGRWQLIPSHEGSGPGMDIPKNAVAFIEINPMNPNHVYAGVGHIMRSKDRGRTWEMIREVDRNVIYIAAFSADNTKLYAMNTYGGFYLYNLPAGPWEFSPYPDSLAGTWVHSIEDSPLLGGILIGSGRGVLVKENGGYSSMTGNLPIDHTDAMVVNGKNIYVASTHVDYLGLLGGIYVRRIE